MMARLFFIMALAMALATSTLALASTNTNEEHATTTLPSDEVISSEEESSPAVGRSRFLAQQYSPRATMTCERFPRICRAEGSPGPDCCKKKCVDVSSDSLNCGQCGLRCKYGTKCCGSRCVNAMFDAKNCGSCKNRCKMGSFCSYGLCSYA